MRRILLVVCIAAALAGCTVGPNYKRPDIPAPTQFRSGEPQPGPASLGDVKWFDLFQDDTLRGLITASLQANYDIRIAAQRVLQAEGRLTATRSGLFPQLDAQGGASRTGVNSPLDSTAGAFGIASWEIDLFGKLRRATEASRAELLAAQENQKAVMQILVAQVASAYFDLREYDAELELVRESIKTRQESLMLVTSREEGGVGSLLDVDQAKTLVASAQANESLLENAQEQTENLINLSVGQASGAGCARQESYRTASAAAGSRRLTFGFVGTPSRPESGGAATDRRQCSSRSRQSRILSQHQSHGFRWYSDDRLAGSNQSVRWGLRDERRGGSADLRLRAVAEGTIRPRRRKARSYSSAIRKLSMEPSTTFPMRWLATRSPRNTPVA